MDELIQAARDHWEHLALLFLFIQNLWLASHVEKLSGRLDELKDELEDRLDELEDRLDEDEPDQEYGEYDDDV